MKFVALFIGGASEAEKVNATLGPSEDFMADMGRWFGKNEGTIVDGGAPLGPTRKVTAGGVSGAKNAVVAYMIVEAGSHQDAARMFEDHPHLALHADNAVEVIECLPVPSP